jgi:broad specificity phosphatase PhoE
MSTRFLLVRHATCALTDSVLLGRSIDAPLDARGAQQATALARRLLGESPALIEASPRLRTQQTALAIAEATGCDVQTSPELDEVDFGCWGGRAFDELQRDPAWRDWNERRSAARTPGGDDIAAIQRRVTTHLHRLARAFPRATVVLVSHAEPIRAALLQYLQWSLDDWGRLTIAPASVTTVWIDPAAAGTPVRVGPIGEIAHA